MFKCTIEPSDVWYKVRIFIKWLWLQKVFSSPWYKCLYMWQRLSFHLTFELIVDRQLRWPTRILISTTLPLTGMEIVLLVIFMSMLHICSHIILGHHSVFYFTSLTSHDLYIKFGYCFFVFAIGRWCGFIQWRWKRSTRLLRNFGSKLTVAKISTS